MLNQKAKKNKGTVIAYWVIVAALLAVIICIKPVMAAEETMWDRFSTIMNDFYGKLLGISTIVAVSMAAIALIIRMVSKNQTHCYNVDYPEFYRIDCGIHTAAYRRWKLWRVIRRRSYDTRLDI